MLSSHLRPHSPWCHRLSTENGALSTYWKLSPRLRDAFHAALPPLISFHPWNGRRAPVAGASKQRYMTSSLLIVTDRGSFKAYAVERTAQRGVMPRLLETFQIADAHGRYQDKVTDQAGAFPADGTAGQGNGMAERMTMETENEARINRLIAQQITSLLHQHQLENWSFAAPSEINGAILDNLSPDLRARLENNLPRNLVKIDPVDLLAHFERAAA